MGFSKSRSTLSVLVTGIWNNFVKLGTPGVALAVLAFEGESGAGSMLAALVGLAGLVAAIVTFALVLRGEPFARKLGLVSQRIATRLRSLFRKGPATGWDLAVVKFRSRVLGLVRHRWLGLTAATIVSHVSLYAVASVLVFRLLTYVLPIVLGGLTYLYWRANHSWRDSAPPMPESLAPAPVTGVPTAVAAPGA